MRRVAYVPALALALLVGACSSSGGGSSPAASVGPEASTAGGASAAASPSSAVQPSTAASAAAACAAAPAGAAAAITVTIKDFKFSPEPVKAKVGDVIIWSNQDTAPHSATLDNGACDTKTINIGSQAGLVFTAPGTYTYHCAIHPTQMVGYTIEVK